MERQKTTPVSKIRTKIIRISPRYHLDYSKTKTNWQLWAELKPSSTMPNFHIPAVFFVIDSIILHIILKVNKLNVFHSILYQYSISIWHMFISYAPLTIASLFWFTIKRRKCVCLKGIIRWRLNTLQCPLHFYIWIKLKTINWILKCIDVGPHVNFFPYLRQKPLALRIISFCSIQSIASKSFVSWLQRLP